MILKIDDKPIAIGRFDMIISLNGSICLTEIKRTSKLYKDKVSLQLNLYRLAYLQCFRDKNIEKLKVIRLYNDKKQFVDIDVDEQKAIDAVKKYYEIYEKFIRDAV